MPWFIDMREWGRGGPVGTIKFGDGTKFFPDAKGLIEAVQGRDVFLMAHGYNVNRQHGIDSLNRWQAKLRIAPEPVFIGVLWPGDCVLPIFLDYVWEGGEADKSGRILGDFVSNNFGGAASISFGAHSLGSRVALNAIQQLADPMRVRQLILLAAAIEDDCLTNVFKDAADKVDHISVVYSQQDHVLQLAYPPGNLLGGVVDRRHPNVKVALGRLGPLDPRTNIWANPRLPSCWNYGHTDYMPSGDVIGSFVVPINPDDLSDPDTLKKVPLDMPQDLDPTKTDWKPCWSAAFASTRWMRS